jgi:hypothetical protein
MLSAKGDRLDPHVLDLLRQSDLASRLSAVRTLEDARHLYRSAELIPHTSTRARAIREAGVSIDGPLAMPGHQKAMFFLAFEGDVPRVLKFPHDQDTARTECLMYESVSAVLPQHPEVYLVPVRSLNVAGTHHSPATSTDEASTRNLRGGILMPMYPCTLSQRAQAFQARSVDSPLQPAATFMSNALQRMSTTLQFLHAQGWLHGDVKPSNIFLDNDGLAWLADYGSSAPLGNVPRLTGTVAYQCQEIPPSAGAAFDLIGLAITALSVIGCLDPVHGSSSGWSMEALLFALDTVPQAPLRDAIRALFPS